MSEHDHAAHAGPGYASPQVAREQPPEKVIYVASLYEGTGIDRPDFVAVVDVDAHHGNGTQELFLGRADVLTASVHVDPGAGWFPHFLGFEAENDSANLNLPLAPGTGDEGWLAAVRRAAEFATPARALVVALGVDAAAGDPESPLKVSAAGYREAGRILGELGLPTVVVQEGGYDLATIGPLVVEFLSGVETHG